MEVDILKLIDRRGPVTGAEVWDAVGGDPLRLWQACRRSDQLTLHTVGCRYLRLDRRMKGYARLSPSLLREFLTYTVVGSVEDTHAASLRAQALLAHIESISRAKVDLAYRIASGLESFCEISQDPQWEACFILAGDIVYNMAHDVLRPERSTGKLVNGSDMDMVVIVDDAMPESLRGRLDDEIFREKARILTAPAIREEIDYVVKRLAKVREQLRFDDFRHMVACKILQEGTFLYGNDRLFDQVKGMLRKSGVTEKLNALEKDARLLRVQAEAHLLQVEPGRLSEGDHLLFYPAEESEEFE